MTIEGLITYEISQAPLEYTNTTIFGAILVRFFGRWESQSGSNIIMNGQGEEVVMPSRVLKH